MPHIAKRRALITGITGQDGFYLAKFLLHKGYKIFGIARDSSTLDESLSDRIDDIFQIDLLDPDSLEDVIQNVAPTEIYHLAAFHFSSQTDRNRTGPLHPFIQINLLVADQILLTIQSKLPHTRFFYPASAQIFGKPDISPQNELTPHRPDTPYAISKSAGLHLCRHFREFHNVFAAVGILYNHESPRRDSSFITTQIAQAAAQAFQGGPTSLRIRDPSAIVDWGSATDYVEAMWLMLQQQDSHELVIATGLPHTIKDFAEAAFGSVGLNAVDYLDLEHGAAKSPRVPYVGDSRMLRRICGWQPRTSFEQLASEMVTENLPVEYRRKNAIDSSTGTL